MTDGLNSVGEFNTVAVMRGKGGVKENHRTVPVKMGIEKETVELLCKNTFDALTVEENVDLVEELHRQNAAAVHFTKTASGNDNLKDSAEIKRSCGIHGLSVQEIHDQPVQNNKIDPLLEKTLVLKSAELTTQSEQSAEGEPEKPKSKPLAEITELTPAATVQIDNQHLAGILTSPVHQVGFEIDHEKAIYTCQAGYTKEWISKSFYKQEDDALVLIQGADTVALRSAELPRQLPDEQAQANANASNATTDVGMTCFCSGATYMGSCCSCSTNRLLTGKLNKKSSR